MTYFNYHLSSSEQLTQELEKKTFILDELQLMAYLKAALTLQEIMQHNCITSFMVKNVKNDYEGGYFIDLGVIKTNKNGFEEVLAKPKEIDWGKASEEEIEAFMKESETDGSTARIELQTWCSFSHVSINTYISVELEPQNYLHHTFTQDLSNIMSAVCPPQFYKTWSILNNKAQLDQQLSSSTSTKKTAPKI